MLLLVRVDVPDDVVGETDDLVPGALGHFCESLGFGLVLECVGGEVDSCFRSAAADCIRMQVTYRHDGHPPSP